jgi:hypothetical protein
MEAHKQLQYISLVAIPTARALTEVNVPALGGKCRAHGQDAVDNKANAEKEEIKRGPLVFSHFRCLNWLFLSEAANGYIELLWVSRWPWR